MVVVGAVFARLSPVPILKLCLLLGLLLKPVFLNNGVAPGVLGGIFCRSMCRLLSGLVR